MTKIIIYSDCTLDRFYEQTLEYLYDKYHTYPATLNEGAMTEAEAVRIACYDGLGQATARRAMEARRASHSQKNMSADCHHKSIGDLPLGKNVF